MISSTDIAAVANAKSNYLFQKALKKLLKKDDLDALDFEPILIELATKNTFRGLPVQLQVDDIAALVNIHLGNLCYRAYYKEDGIPRTLIDYANTWGELLTVLAKRAKSASDYIELACCVQLQFAAFEDRAECEQFANENYYYAIEELDDVTELVDLVGGHLTEEYYENKELALKAGMKALAKASTFQEFAYICFDDCERCNFHGSELYVQAADQAILLKEQASNDELAVFKAMLIENEDNERVSLL